MGLDMYLEKTKRINGATLEQLENAGRYLSWEVDKRASRTNGCSPEEWNCCDMKKVCMPIVDELRSALYARGSKIIWADIWVEVGYWRKANAIHNWFVKNVQDGVDDCGRYEVCKENLEELKELCEKIIENPSRANELLPTCSGFFFGSTNYDDWYMEDIKNTIAIIDGVLEETDFDNEIVTYSSSW